MAAGEGHKTVYVKFRDTAGNWSSPAADTIVLDTINPSVQITSPPDGAIITDP